MSRRGGYTELESAQTAFLAQVLLLQGDLDTAERLADEALELADRAASRWARGWAQSTLGQVAAQRGDLEVARRLLEEAVDSQRVTGYTHDLRSSLITLAGVASDQGATAHAARLLNECLRLALVSAPAPTLLLILEALAEVVVATQPRTAARLAGAAEAHRAALGVKRRPIEGKRFHRTVALATDACGRPAFEYAWAEGSRLTPAQAHLEALELTARLAALPPDQQTSSHGTEA
jgi:ATP/maltotriose-dependent transcriptional regulator MalT